ncbi:carboxypeptidase-like regulatory domain-containing protein [Maribacter sp. BPC-D8]|uniref:carboxypeptidase-like regulatory domain-containing protein n=1 Tax=Maribacter sp. BPC-D8 TaxID=3053613 RepID=UPI002B499B6D|nr:carboxypeptidase-like regulatory domain-containing protein [Maribacter sp. BPC-D8]WRI31238.1 carboxypeptidase-like regulatory domain-containing protein [Maribacter sp. BPC-D8]
MKSFLIILIFSITFVNAQSNIVKGKITQMDAPLANVKISIINSDIATTTDANGVYQISAEARDVIQYTYPGLNDVQILVEDVTRILNIEMSQEIHQLDEVTVKGSNRKSQNELQQEYSYNPNLIKTAYGILDSETAPGKIRFLQENQINDVGICILDLMKNEFPGVNVVGDCVYGGLIYIRGLNSVSQAPPAVYDVDGQVLTQTPTWIAPAAIKRLAVLNNLAMTTRYGSIGAGGVIVINTKASAYSRTVDGKPIDYAKVKNNKYDNLALSSVDFKEDKPLYLNELLSANTEERAKAIYAEQIKKYSSSYYYVLDAYDYFSNKWKNQEFADMIIQDNDRVLSGNPLALKSLAYIYQAEGKFKEANKLYEDVYTLRADYAQSYLDLANSYRELGLSQKSAAMYLRYDYLLAEELLEKEEQVKTIMDRDLNNLISLKGADLVSTDKVNEIKIDDDFKGTRLVFEWSDSEAEFELQFVNPEKRYYKSEHSLVADAERIQSEKRTGFSSEEYLIDDTLRGTWLVNATYLGNKSLTPTYLKATVYYNYGSASQRKETKVFKLGLRNINQQLFSVSNAASMVAN